jgi:hypothetical protein
VSVNTTLKILKYIELWRQTCILRTSDAEIWEDCNTANSGHRNTILFLHLPLLRFVSCVCLVYILLLMLLLVRQVIYYLKFCRATKSLKGEFPLRSQSHWFNESDMLWTYSQILLKITVYVAVTLKFMSCILKGIKYIYLRTLLYVLSECNFVASKRKLSWDSDRIVRGLAKDSYWRFYLRTFVVSDIWPQEYVYITVWLQ